jgi:hypothetical protein
MLDNDLSTDQAASIRAVIAQEQATVAWYKHLIAITEPGALKVRLVGLRAYHVKQIKRRREELKHG